MVKKGRCANTVVMTEAADSIVQDIVKKKQNETGGQSVDQFTKDVQEEAAAVADELQVTYGDAVKNIAGAVMDSARSYAESRRDVLDPHANVGDAHAIGAAAYTNMSNGSVTYDTSAMDFTLEDPGYWERVKEHEKIHQKEQAGVYNEESITYIDATGTVVRTEVQALIEWQPSSRANITSDLTPEYQQHVKDGDQLAQVTGEDRIEQALKDGDMQAMQKEILEEQLPKIMEQKFDVTVGADVSS